MIDAIFLFVQLQATPQSKNMKGPLMSVQAVSSQVKFDWPAAVCTEPVRIQRQPVDQTASDMEFRGHAYG